MFLTHWLIKGAQPTQHLFWFLDRFPAELHGGVVSPWPAWYTWKSRQQDRNVCYHVCEWDTKLPERAFHLSLIKLKRKITLLKIIQGVSEIFETKESTKPIKTHGFITDVRRQEQELWPCQMWPLSTVGCSWAFQHYRHPQLLPHLTHTHHRHAPAPPPSGCEVISWGYYPSLEGQPGHSGLLEQCVQGGILTCPEEVGLKPLSWTVVVEKHLLRINNKKGM